MTGIVQHERVDDLRYLTERKGLVDGENLKDSVLRHKFMCRSEK